MPFTTIPTVSTGQVLTASYLNLLGSNMGFLYGLANQSNTPFNSIRVVQGQIDAGTAIWYVRHKVPWLHWKVTSQGGGWNYARMYFNGVKVGGQESTNTVFQSNYNLASWAGLPNLLGAWASGVAYDDDVNGDGDNGEPDDGHVVTSGGQYYRCKVAHTSAGGNQPPNGTYWDLLTLPGVNTMCSTWVTVNFPAATEVTVEYILESDSASF